MRSRKSNDYIKILQQDAVIPKIVEQKMEDAFCAIRKVEKSCEIEPEHVAVHTEPVKKSWSFIPAAVFALCLVTACAATYTKWSQSLESRLQISEVQKQKLEENKAWSVLDQSMTSEGVTVTAMQCIVDSYCAYITFKIEGYQLPEGASPSMKRMKAEVGDHGSQNIYYYGDFYQDTLDKQTDSWLRNMIPMTIPMENDTADGSFVMEDGSLEYQVRILTMQKKALLGKTIHVTLQGLGSRTEESRPVYDNHGIWEFDWTLEGSVETAEIVLDKTLGDTGTTIRKVEISPISVKYTFERSNTRDLWPKLLGFRTKDGKIHLNITGSGMIRFENFMEGRYTSISVTTRIMEADQIDALLFVDMMGQHQSVKEELNKYMYTVPIR